MGEGRIVEAVPLTGPGKFLKIAVVPLGNGTFEFNVTNPLKEQGQHVMLQPTSTAAWTVTPSEWNANLEAGKSATLRAEIKPSAAGGAMVDPIPFDLVTDIGGRQTYYAYVDAGQVTVVDDMNAASAGPFGAADKEAGAPPLSLLVIALAVGLVLHRSRAR